MYIRQKPRESSTNKKYARFRDHVRRVRAQTYRPRDHQNLAYRGYNRIMLFLLTITIKASPVTVTKNRTATSKHVGMAASARFVFQSRTRRELSLWARHAACKSNRDARAAHNMVRRHTWPHGPESLRDELRAM